MNMKTNPTPSIAGAAGTALSYEAIQSGRDMATRPSNHSKANSGISDSLETSDREGDGRQMVSPKRNETGEAKSINATGDRLDLTG